MREEQGAEESTLLTWINVGKRKSNEHLSLTLNSKEFFMNYLVKGAAIAAVLAAATPAFAQTAAQLNNAEFARVAASVPAPFYPIVYPAYAAGAVAAGAATAAVAVPAAAAAPLVYPYQYQYPYPYPFFLAPLAVVPGVGWYYWDGNAWQWRTGTKS